MAAELIGEEVENDNVRIDIPLVMEPAIRPRCCIYSVPKNLRTVNKEAYTPRIVSIGPFHHNTNNLSGMEMHKLRYLKDFLYRTGKSQEDLLMIIQDNEVEICQCYSEECRLSRTDFVKMVLLDAIFIIELFLRFHGRENDYISSQPWLGNAIRHDLILLENQLPFFVIEKLFVFACRHELTFPKLSLVYFRPFISHDGMQLPEFNIEEVKHFTDLVRYMLCSIPGLQPIRTLDNLYCAAKLDEVGLKLKRAETRRLLDIRFTGNKCVKYCPCFNLSWLLACLPCLKSFLPLERMQVILEIPPLNIYDETESIFRNLMALEQCHYPSNTYICNYVVLLDYIIDTKADVDLLVEKNIIVNNIGSNDAVTNMINKLSTEISEGESCYYDIAQEINKYCDNHWNHIMATMKSVYFRDFWRGTTTVVGLIVLGFTFWGFLRPYVKGI